MCYVLLVTCYVLCPMSYDCVKRDVGTVQVLEGGEGRREIFKE